jgi:hypothetical protein
MQSQAIPTVFPALAIPLLGQQEEMCPLFESQIRAKG